MNYTTTNKNARIRQFWQDLGRFIINFVIKKSRLGKIFVARHSRPNPINSKKILTIENLNNNLIYFAEVV